MRGDSAFLTGPPGAGKTHTLNEFIRQARASGKTVAVTASTGIAATHIGGTTIHSWSGLGIREVISEHEAIKLQANSKLIKRYNGTDVLVIDEVSMLHGHRLDLVNHVAKMLRKSDKPFGGMQVILVGDLFQLPPITRGRDIVDFVHHSEAWQELSPTICYLTEQHRVSGNDELLDLLGAMRRGDINEFHEQALRERLEASVGDQTVTKLYSHNTDVDSINDQHLRALTGDGKRFLMGGTGSKTKQEALRNSVLAPEALILKRGAEVMFVANNFPQGFVNGTRGTVVDFVDNRPLVETREGEEIKVEPHSWKYEEDGRVQAELTQLPLRLAWAITIHKSQGMSLDAAEIDLSRSFTPGMGYVALSRVRGMDGVYLRGVNNLALAMHPDIFEFDGALREASEAVASVIEDFAPDTKTANEDEPVENELLLAELKAWRTERARRDKIAPYMVLHDTTLQELARRKPQTEQALLGVKGLGPMKIEKFGQEILGILT
ncbi:MAG: ATP-dependent helicase [Patescibacteria group bacterium]|nr:ATP-dependent helicase [Patescibacteria group bacterium]